MYVDIYLSMCDCVCVWECVTHPHYRQKWNSWNPTSMYAHKYIYIYIYIIHVYTYTHPRLCINVYIHILEYVCLCVRVRVCNLPTTARNETIWTRHLYIYTNIYTYKYTYTCIHIYTHTYMYKCTYTYMCVCVCMWECVTHPHYRQKCNSWNSLPPEMKQLKIVCG